MGPIWYKERTHGYKLSSDIYKCALWHVCAHRHTHTHIHPVSIYLSRSGLCSNSHSLKDSLVQMGSRGRHGIFGKVAPKVVFSSLLA